MNFGENFVNFGENTVNSGAFPVNFGILSETRGQVPYLRNKEPVPVALSHFFRKCVDGFD